MGKNYTPHAGNEQGNTEAKKKTACRGPVHAPPHWLQAGPPLSTKLSFPAQIQRGQVLNLATRVKRAKNV